MSSSKHQVNANCGKNILTMEQVINKVHLINERSFKEEIGVRISQEEIANLSYMLNDVDAYSMQKYGKSFYDLKCTDIDFVFLHSYKEDLLSRKGGMEKFKTAKNHLAAIHWIFILCDGFYIADMDIDMFELFLEQCKQEGVL